MGGWRGVLWRAVAIMAVVVIALLVAAQVLSPKIPVPGAQQRLRPRCRSPTRHGPCCQDKPVASPMVRDMGAKISVLLVKYRGDHAGADDVGSTGTTTGRGMVEGSGPPGHTGLPDGAAARLPMVDLFGPRRVSTCRALREQWSTNIALYIEQYSQLDERWYSSGNRSWFRYDLLGPEFPLCPESSLVHLGEGDESKVICGLDLLLTPKNTPQPGSCEVVSIGSNGWWQFEEAIYERTKCRVHTFDCTGDFKVPLRIADRVTFYRLCLGDVAGDTSYVSYSKLLLAAGLSVAPAYLKMDVEGFEWQMLPHMFADAPQLLPEQISFELHRVPDARGARLLGWPNHRRTVRSFAQLGQLLYDAGYLIIDRRDNSHSCNAGDAAEFLIARVAHLKQGSLLGEGYGPL